MPHEQGESGPHRRLSVGGLVLIALGLAGGGYWYYTIEKDDLYHEEYLDLAAIGELKVAQVAAWRQARMADVRRPTDSPFFRAGLAAWRDAGFGAGRRPEWRVRLGLERDYGFADALLLDPDGRVLLAADEGPAFVGAATRRAAAQAIAERGPALSDVYRAPDGGLYLDAIAPVFDDAGGPLALLVQRSDAGSVLFPLVESWPVPGGSGEAYLVRPDGDDVLVVSRQRHQPGAALSRRYPMSEVDRPAVQAVLGRVGALSGRDYRGVDVLADVRPVPASPWFLVVKVDSDEVLVEARYRAGAIAVVVVSFILLAAAVTAYLSRMRLAGLYRSLSESERQHREAEKAFRTTLYSIGDAVITTDNDGRVRQMNPAAERLTGWREAEARGWPSDEVFHIVDEETRERVESPVERVIGEGTVMALASHPLLVARDGTARPIGDSGAPIRDDTGTVTGVVRRSSRPRRSGRGPGSASRPSTAS